MKHRYIKCGHAIKVDDTESMDVIVLGSCYSCRCKGREAEILTWVKDSEEIAEKLDKLIAEKESKSW